MREVSQGIAYGSTLVLMAWVGAVEGHRHLRSSGGTSLLPRLRAQEQEQEGAQRMSGLFGPRPLSNYRHKRTRPSCHRKLGYRRFEEHMDCQAAVRAYRDHMPAERNCMRYMVFVMW